MVYVNLGWQHLVCKAFSQIHKNSFLTYDFFGYQNRGIIDHDADRSNIILNKFKSVENVLFFSKVTFNRIKIALEFWPSCGSFLQFFQTSSESNDLQTPSDQIFRNYGTDATRGTRYHSHSALPLFHSNFLVKKNILALMENSYKRHACTKLLLVKKLRLYFFVVSPLVIKSWKKIHEFFFYYCLVVVGLIILCTQHTYWTIF